MEILSDIWTRIASLSRPLHQVRLGVSTAFPSQGKVNVSELFTDMSCGLVMNPGTSVKRKLFNKQNYGIDSFNYKFKLCHQ